MVMYKELSTSNGSKTVFSPGDQFDFLLKTGMGNELIANSICIEGVLYIVTNKASALPDTVGGPTLQYYDDVQYHSECGIHAFFQQFHTALMGGKVNGGIENLQSYPRYVRMSTIALKDQEAISLESTSIKELKCTMDAQSRSVMIGNNVPTTIVGGVIVPGNAEFGTPFSFRPMIALNRTMRNMRYDEIGDVTLSCTLSQVIQALYGTGVFGVGAIPGLTYTIKDLKLRYAYQPAQKYDMPLEMRTVSMTDYGISSSTSYNVLEVPGNTESIVTSFANDQALAVDDISIVNPNISLVKWNYNDENNIGVSFELLTIEEMLVQYIYAMNDTLKSNSIRPLNANTKFSVGMNIGSLIPQKTKVTCQFQTDADGVGIKYSVFSYFNSILQI